MTEESAGASAGSLIKIDRMGRMRFSREQREKILDAYEAGGSSGTDFAEIHGIKYQTLATWIQRRRRERRLMQGAVDAAHCEPSIALTEVELGSETAVAPITPLVLNLPGGVEMTLDAMGQVPVAAALLKSLARENHAELQR